MNKTCQKILLVALCLSGAIAEPKIPRHWEFYASRAAIFEGGRVTTGTYQGSSAARISSVKAPHSEHALLYQKISADQFLGKSLEVSGYLKTIQVEGWAGLWVRVDDADGKVLKFDNMMNQPVRGSTPWKRHVLKLDVPPNASEIHFGALLSGRGEVVVDNFAVKATGRLLPGQDLKKRIRELPENPANLSFEQ